MLDKHPKSHPLATPADQDITAQKLFVALCLCGSCLVLFHVAQDIPLARWTGIPVFLTSLAYAARQFWKLSVK